LDLPARLLTGGSSAVKLAPLMYVLLPESEFFTEAKSDQAAGKTSANPVSSLFQNGLVRRTIAFWMSEAGPAPATELTGPEPITSGVLGATVELSGITLTGIHNLFISASSTTSRGLLRSWQYSRLWIPTMM
jgi:hypothetical protein